MCVGGGMGAAGIFERPLIDRRDRERHDHDDSATREAASGCSSDAAAGGVVHARAADRRAPADRPDRSRVRRRRRCCRSSTELETEGLERSRARSSGACGELGLLGVDVPEAYGGLGLDKVASHRRQRAWRAPRRSRTTFGAQTNLAILPLLLLRHRGAEAAVPAAAGDRRDRRRLLPERVRLRIGCARRAGARRRDSPTAASC